MHSCANGCGACRTPFTGADRKAVCRFDISILQAELSTPQCSTDARLPVLPAGDP